MFIAIMISTFHHLHGQDIAGQWNGLLKVQGLELPLVFHISPNDTGYTATMDSPDQGAIGLPVNSTTFENNILQIQLNAIGIQYRGQWQENNTFSGEFTQGGMTVPLDLSRDKISKTKVNRPQEPIPPYPYYTEEVRFKNNEADIVLAGTLSLPEKNGIFPAVVLISGSGPQNRDEELMGHKPFLVLADDLTRKGIAVLRFDDRGTAESTGQFNTATTKDLATDVKAAVQYLSTRSEINDYIGLIGHSEGGIIAPIVASDMDNIDFIVLLAGTGIRGDRLLLLQQELINKANGMTEEEWQEIQPINATAIDMVLNSSNLDSLSSALMAYFEDSVQKKEGGDLPGGMGNKGYLEAQVQQLSTKWMQYFIQFDPATALEKVRCPVLALIGEKDLQVPAEVNLNAIKTALKQGGNHNVTTITLPNLNHLFQECNTGSPNEYATIEQTFSPIALDTISHWIKDQINQ
ncbi:alpha/beta fold hydrolase [Membranihabitans marinus]